MKELRLSAKASKNGVIYDLPAQVGTVAAWLTALEGKRIEVTYREIKDVRSLAQNRRYWSLVVPVVAEVLSSGRELPLSKDQAHYALKLAFIGHEDTPLGPVPKSSKELDTAQFAAFCSKVEEWLVTTWGVVVPDRLEDGL